MLTWIPDPSTSPWAEVQEDEVWAESIISAVDDSTPPLLVTNYSMSVIGDSLTGLTINCNAFGISVSAPESLVGTFPTLDIEYQINRVTGHCSTFSELPTNADEIIKYQPNTVSQKDWTLRAVATLSDGSTGTADFVLRVYANFTTGCTALKEAVNARRH